MNYIYLIILVMMSGCQADLNNEQTENNPTEISEVFTNEPNITEDSSYFNDLIELEIIPRTRKAIDMESMMGEDSNKTSETNEESDSNETNTSNSQKENNESEEETEDEDNSTEPKETSEPEVQEPDEEPQDEDNKTVPDFSKFILEIENEESEKPKQIRVVLRTKLYVFSIEEEDTTIKEVSSGYLIKTVGYTKDKDYFPITFVTPSLNGSSTVLVQKTNNPLIQSNANSNNGTLIISNTNNKITVSLDLVNMNILNKHNASFILNVNLELEP